MREKKKGQRGNAAGFITRGQALRKLQISLKDFRRLCILKGIYPRDPRKKTRGKDKTYYLGKDIAYLAHEPLLAKFRDYKAFAKRIARARGRNDAAAAGRIAAQRPRYVLDGVVRERYPTFGDALRDLDDPLAMLHLFAALPRAGRLHRAVTERCARLCAEFQHYVVAARALRRVFVSLKGIYYQAEVHGVTVTWMAPHQLVAAVPRDVDLRIMLTFVELYETLLGFVNHKLYADLGLHHPPDFDFARLDQGHALLAAIVVRSLDAMPVDAAAAAAATTTDTDAGAAAEAAAGATTTATTAAPALSKNSLARLGKKLQQVDLGHEDDQQAAEDEAAAAAVAAAMGGDGDAEFDDEAVRAARRDERRLAAFGRLFEGKHFFLGREVPHHALLFALRAFGGRVTTALDGREDDPSVTHQIVDRPALAARFVAREYVQPQWVFDSINARLLLPLADYAPGQRLPPHLSPFVDNDRVGYTPARAEELRALTAAAHADDADGSGGDDGGADDDDGADTDGDDDGDDLDDDDDDDDDEDEATFRRELAAESSGVSFSKASAKKPRRARPSDSDDEDADDGDDGGDDDDSGAAAAAAPKLGKRAARDKARKEEQELGAIMLPKKTRRLYQSVQRSQLRKSQKADRLMNKRRNIEEEQRRSAKAKAAGAAGRRGQA